MQNAKFELGEKVKWSYTTKGNEIECNGEVIAIIPDGILPYRYLLRKIGDLAKITKKFTNHAHEIETYVIKVQDLREKISLYRPRPHTLRKA